MQTPIIESSYDDTDATDDNRDPRANLRAVADRAQTFVVDHPLAALGVALGTGFFVGRLFRR